MKSIVYSIVVFIFLSIGCKNSIRERFKENATPNTTYYLIRHAEKDRSDTSNKNPELTSKGLERAQYWSRYFDTIHLDHIYSTRYKRTQQTAMPTATQKQLSIKFYDPETLYPSTFKTETKETTTLVVGHSNTTPAFVNAIIGKNKYGDIPDDENGRLYTVILKDNDTLVTVATIQ